VNWETLKTDLYGVLLGVVLIILLGVMSDFFETDPFFGMSIMLLAIIVVKLSYLVDLARKRSGRDPAGETTIAKDRGE
jgi:hypothetical protein